MPEIPCPACSTQLNVEPMKLEIGNSEIYSQVMILHPKGIDCANCGGYFIPAVTGCQYAIILAPVEKPKDAPKIIIPNLGLQG